MEPLRLPDPSELQPGTRWPLGPGLLLVIRDGKHAGGDLRIDIEGRGSPTHAGVFILLLALMQAEERYRRLDPKKKGGEYFITHLGTVAHWWRSYARRGERFAYRIDTLNGEDFRTPSNWMP